MQRRPQRLPRRRLGANAFNPAISLILSGLYTRTSQDPARYAITRLRSCRAGAEVGPGTRGFSLAESELGFAASIDPWLRGAANIALHGDDTVSVEEAYVQTTSLGNGLSLKAGRFFSGVGYLNSQHAHTWDFVDNPLAYQAMLGTQYGDDGVQLTWLAPTDQFIEFGLELGRGRSFPGGDNSRNGAGMTALTAHTGGDIGDSHNWRAGLSVLSAKASDQRLIGLDAAGSAVTQRLQRQHPGLGGRRGLEVGAQRQRHAHQLQACRANTCAARAAAIWSTTSATPTAPGRTAPCSRAGTCKASTSSCRAGASACAPSDSNPGTPDYGANAGLLDGSDYRPRKNTLMLDFNASEFSRVRLQLAQDRAREGFADNQLFLQYQMSLGAHGAHGY